MFNLLTTLEIGNLSDNQLLDMIVKLSNAIAETKSMQEKGNKAQKLYHSLKVEHEHRKISVDSTKRAGV